MAVRAVMLDLGNVLIPVDFSRCHEGLKRIGAPPVQEVAGKIQSSGMVEAFEQGEVSPAEFCRKVSSAFHLDIGSQEFWDIWNTMYAPEPSIPEAMLAGLRRSVRLILLSNTNPVHFEMVHRRHRLFEHFDDCIVSFRVGAMKPDDRIYQAALATAGCPPEECFFADDMLPFVAGARSHGIDAVQFQSLEQLQDEFRARGIGW